MRTRTVDGSTGSACLWDTFGNLLPSPSVLSVQLPRILRKEAIPRHQSTHQIRAATSSTIGQGGGVEAIMSADLCGAFPPSTSRDALFGHNEEASLLGCDPLHSGLGISRALPTPAGGPDDTKARPTGTRTCPLETDRCLVVTRRCDPAAHPPTLRRKDPHRDFPTPWPWNDTPGDVYVPES
jgi:hypothetical protein